MVPDFIIIRKIVTVDRKQILVCLTRSTVVERDILSLLAGLALLKSRSLRDLGPLPLVALPFGIVVRVG